jgi:hypothetical protein
MPFNVSSIFLAPAESVKLSITLVAGFLRILDIERAFWIDDCVLYIGHLFCQAQL